MTSVPIFIGGAAGATGSVATKLLLQMGFPVRAIVSEGMTARSAVQPGLYAFRKT